MSGFSSSTEQFSSTNFFLHYQGRDVLELQQHYAHLIERLTQKIYQEFHKEIKIKQSIAFIKIGFISSFFRMQMGWFGNLFGDFSYRGDGFRVYVPFMSMIVISIVLTLVINIALRIFK